MGFWVTLGETCSEKVEKPFINKSRLFKGNGNSEKEKIYMRYVIVWRTFQKDSPFQKSTFLMKILGSVTFDLNIQKGWNRGCYAKEKAYCNWSRGGNR